MYSRSGDQDAALLQQGVAPWHATSDVAFTPECRRVGRRVPGLYLHAYIVTWTPYQCAEGSAIRGPL